MSEAYLVRAEPRVRLIAYNAPTDVPVLTVAAGDNQVIVAAKRPSPAPLPILAAKVSQGRLREKDPSYYIAEYPHRKPEELKRWLLLAAKRFPSVLEHITFTFFIEGISRVCSHQLVRHRLASYTQESQRYSAQHPEVVVPRTVREKGFEEEFAELCTKAYELYKRMCEEGVPPEDARFVLPQAFTTKILMTVNLRELLHIAKLRLTPEAQWEIREVVRQMIEEASRVVPEVKDMLKELRGEEA